MYKLIEKNEGTVTEKKYDSLETLKADLQNYFAWILDNEPSKELPSFESCTTVEDINYILKDWDYSWWSLEVE